MGHDDHDHDQDIRVLGIAGSLRGQSFNRILVRAAAELAPDGMTVEVFDLSPVPLYNGDVEAQGDPDGVVAFKDAIARSNACFIATPEYQTGVPGVLKNALDWASRPAKESVLEGKPVAIAGATPGMWGTARAQIQLRQTLGYNNCRMVHRPELLIARAADKFDEAGTLTDPKARELLERLLVALGELVRMPQPAST